MGLDTLFGGTYAGRRVLLTGHTGFKGSWLAHWLVQMGARVSGFALHPDTSPSHWHLLALADVDDIRGDLRDPDAVYAAMQRCQPEIVFHLGAQALVRRSYRQPALTFASNIMGVVNLLEAVRSCSSVKAVVNATTDKVYAERDTAEGYSERDPLGGHDPYSTSKACAELVSSCYRQAYFNSDVAGGSDARIATARAGNVIGGGDWSQDRIVPDIVRALMADEAVCVRQPLAVRPWQHVLEPLSGYLRLGQELLAGRAVDGPWNFGPHPAGELTVGALISLLAQEWPSLRMTAANESPLHEAKVLRLDCQHATEDLQWRPVWDVARMTQRTAAWYRAFLASGEVRTGSDLDAYVRDARVAGLGWAT